MKALATVLLVLGLLAAARGEAAAAGLRVGAAAAEIEADDTMVIAGGIGPGRAQGQEGKLLATAVVVQHAEEPPVAIVSCDVIAVTRDFVEPALAEIEKATGIPSAHVLVHATHTHHAPSTVRVHAYGRCEAFVDRLRKAIVRAVADAKARLADSGFWFKMGREATVGANSRLQLRDGTIYWVGSREDATGPTGQFDPDLPVLGFRSPSGAWQAVLFGHSTHTIGGLRPGVRSPAFYGMAAQELGKELGAAVAFLEGASGSTHSMDLAPAESFRRIKQAVSTALGEARPYEVRRVAGLRRPLAFKVRQFDEAAEQQAVSQYCLKRIGPHAESTIDVFRQMRKELAPQQGQPRTTTLQVLAIGDVALVGVPAELFTRLGVEIKRRSPFPQTVVVELSNDWIGYVGDREAYRLGGYQLWMGLHSYCDPDTGSRLVDQAVEMLAELRTPRQGPPGEGRPAKP